MTPDAERRPRLTAKVVRGLRHIHSLAEADLDADLSADYSRYTKTEIDEFRRALDWLMRLFAAEHNRQHRSKT